MANWKITISGKNIRKDAVDKLAQSLKDRFGEGVSIHVTDNSPPESRADRLSVAMNHISECKSEVEALRDEMQEWYDNLPEGFQNGQKGEDIQAAVDSLEEILNDLENLEGRDGDVSFPGMYG